MFFLLILDLGPGEQTEKERVHGPVGAQSGDFGVREFRLQKTSGVSGGFKCQLTESTVEIASSFEPTVQEELSVRCVCEKRADESNRGQCTEKT